MNDFNTKEEIRHYGPTSDEERRRDFEEARRQFAETFGDQCPIHEGAAGLPHDYEARGIPVMTRPEKRRERHEKLIWARHRITVRVFPVIRARSASRQYHRVGRIHTTSISKRGSPDDIGDPDLSGDLDLTEPPSVTPTKKSKKLNRTAHLWRRHDSCLLSFEGGRSL
jgi:hypothetical protein